MRPVPRLTIGLEVEDELRSTRPLSEGRPPAASALHEVDVHLRVVAVEAPLATRLGAVHREVGVPEQPIGVPDVGARDRQAEAPAHQDLVPVDRER